jgi:hypothetical protein
MLSTSYIQGADLPDLTINWVVGGVLLDMTGHTFVLRLGTPGDPAVLEKTTGITGAATSPNVTIAWATTGELNTLAAGFYQAHLVATRTSDSKQRIMPFGLTVRSAIQAA